MIKQADPKKNQRILFPFKVSPPSLPLSMIIHWFNMFFFWVKLLSPRGVAVSA